MMKTLLACLALVPLTVHADVRTCRTTVFPESAWTKGEDLGLHLHVTRDLDGDDMADELVASTSDGSGAASVSASFRSSRAKKTYEVSYEMSFDSMMSFVATPRDLAADPIALKVVEDALFRTTCTTAEPSLAWLLDPAHALRWIDGAPKLPETYMVRSTRAEDLARRKPATSVWIEYYGHNHGRGADLDIGHAPHELTHDGERVLLGTAHGVILTNPARTRHAWIYVAESSKRKLRFPSVRGAKIEGDLAVIDTINGPIRVDLRDGKLATR